MHNLWDVKGAARFRGSARKHTCSGAAPIDDQENPGIKAVEKFCPRGSPLPPGGLEYAPVDAWFDFANSIIYARAGRPPQSPPPPTAAKTDRPRARTPLSRFSFISRLPRSRPLPHGRINLPCSPKPPSPAVNYCASQAPWAAPPPSPPSYRPAGAPGCSLRLSPPPNLLLP